MQESPDSSMASVHRWTTDTVVPGRRLDYWVGAICEAFLEMDCSSRQAGAFDGQITRVAVDALSFNQVVASTQDVFRTPAGIARGCHYPLYLITQLNSSWHVRQGGHMAQLRPGDTVLVDSAQCYELHFPDSVSCLSVQLPRPWVGRWLSLAQSRVPRVAARDQGWGQTLSALCLQLGRDPSLAAAYPQALLSDQLGAMLAAALEPQQQPAASPVSRSLVERARLLLREQLDQPGLTAQAVARTVGVSVRTLHRGFATEQTSFAGTLRRLRLEHAAQLLAQPRLAHLTVAEIGRRCGFSDASHFVREFQRAFVVTPGRWRRERAGR